jgi:hypothetical protein
MKKKRKGPKRLTVEIDENMHHRIRLRASFRNITIRLWVLRVLTEALLTEEHNHGGQPRE